MELALNPEARRLIEQNVRDGRFGSPEDAVHAALAALSRSAGDFAAGEWDRLPAEGEASAASEGTLDGDEALAGRRARRAARRAGGR